MVIKNDKTKCFIQHASHAYLAFIKAWEKFLLILLLKIRTKIRQIDLKQV